MSEPFVGEIRTFGFNFAPRGWAFCNGQLLPIAQNSTLFSLLGTIYGGDGRTNFALPDLRGRAAVHIGQGPGLSDYRIGNRGGVESSSLQVSNLPSHTHDLPATDGAMTTNRPGNAMPSRGGSYAVASDDTAMAPTGATGSSAPFTNMPPYLAINWCIALVGLYPSRS